MPTYDATTLNLKTSAYETAITQLKTKLSELELAREDYETRGNAIKDFWEGDAAEEAKQVIAEAVAKVDTASKNVKENIAAFEKAQQGGDSLNKTGTQALEDVRKSIQDLF